VKLIVLGSGTCVPSLKRNAPGYYIAAGGLEILVDCGSGTLRQLERTGRSYKDIDAVFITHRHPDHFTDLMPLIQALIATPDFKRKKELSIIGPTEVISYYNEAVATVMGTYVNFPIKLIEIRNTLDFGPYKVSAARTVHSGESLAYRFEYEGRSLVFTGDADYDQGIVALSEGADMLVADCSFPDAKKVRGHLSAKECGLVARKAGVKKLLLSHLYAVGLAEEDRITESREEFDGQVVLAEDLMEFDI
jgi:ribonuclease BN (tRNA processing enzyme)